MSASECISPRPGSLVSCVRRCPRQSGVRWVVELCDTAEDIRSQAQCVVEIWVLLTEGVERCKGMDEGILAAALNSMQSLDTDRIVIVCVVDMRKKLVRCVAVRQLHHAGGGFVVVGVHLERGIRGTRRVLEDSPEKTFENVGQKTVYLVAPRVSVDLGKISDLEDSQRVIQKQGIEDPGFRGKESFVAQMLCFDLIGGDFRDDEFIG